MTPSQISKLSTTQLVSLTLKGHLGISDSTGEVVFTDKAARAADRSVIKARRANVLSELTEFFTSPAGQAASFFSIKPTSGSFAAASFAINSAVEASREDILWSLKQLEKSGLAEQVGVKATEVEVDGKTIRVPAIVDASEVNNFQRRWVHTVPAAEVEDETAEA
jgi:hypothetical protein